MGGLGSGQWYRGSGPTTCEEVKRIDIRFMKKNGWLYPGFSGSLYWNVGGEPAGNIRYTVQEQSMLLNFKARHHCDDEWQPIKQTIWFDQTRCHYGGSRKWFECPNCKTRVAVLYGADALFLCRHCYRLPYASQGESDLDRMLRKQNKIKARIDPDVVVFNEKTGRPIGMHWKTFIKLKHAENTLEEQINNGFMARFGYWM
jgi:hypothetical protein